MSLGGGRFSDEEVRLLRGLAAVANATRVRITYSDSFRKLCMRRYLAGESPVKIFREAGLDPELIGYKRIERSVARWKTTAFDTFTRAAEERRQAIKRRRERALGAALRIVAQPKIG